MQSPSFPLRCTSRFHQAQIDGRSKLLDCYCHCYMHSQLQQQHQHYLGTKGRVQCPACATCTIGPPCSDPLYVSVHACMCLMFFPSGYCSQSKSGHILRLGILLLIHTQTCPQSSILANACTLATCSLSTHVYQHMHITPTCGRASTYNIDAQRTCMWTYTAICVRCRRLRGTYPLFLKSGNLNRARCTAQVEWDINNNDGFSPHQKPHMVLPQFYLTFGKQPLAHIITVESRGNTSTSSNQEIQGKLGSYDH
ncbi:hypothetical protein WUBG_02040 [Wuchereria bancrofti]|uniref:Uncharacterized protein n=1 Tax=Wuchereria bancrofti TaxID=6293 RepID=J9FIB0_WUCBA|nr:hypothetical protein WUBG_02040 [Wuchereria bancrofti]